MDRVEVTCMIFAPSTRLETTMIITSRLRWTVPPAIVLLAAFLAPASVAAPQRTQPELKRNLQEKLAKPFVKKTPWRLDYKKACEESSASGRPIFIYFTRTFAP